MIHALSVLVSGWYAPYGQVAFFDRISAWGQVEMAAPKTTAGYKRVAVNFIVGG